MRVLSAITGIGVFAFILVLLREVMDHPMWEQTGEAPTTLEFADALFNDWSVATVVLGGLLAMALIGASYLVRDERLINLIWGIGGEEE
jgi:NADH:ubiquinone oxidoreductase subunit 6 (subunit J)